MVEVVPSSTDEHVRAVRPDQTVYKIVMPPWLTTHLELELFPNEDRSSIVK